VILRQRHESIRLGYPGIVGHGLLGGDQQGAVLEPAAVVHLALVAGLHHARPIAGRLVRGGRLRGRLVADRGHCRKGTRRQQGHHPDQRSLYNVLYYLHRHTPSLYYFWLERSMREIVTSALLIHFIRATFTKVHERDKEDQTGPSNGADHPTRLLRQY
jgi:hypothetical protein